MRWIRALAYSFDGSLALAHFLPLEDLSGASLSILESDGAMLLDEPLVSLSLPSRERIDEVVSGVAQPVSYTHLTLPTTPYV